MTEAWKHWEGQIVEGKFHLRRYLGGSEHSVVYLTENPEGQSQAAIKLVAADPANADARLKRWRRAAKLSHPHLIRILQVGSCRLESTNLLYVVMEYAEEDLSQILPVRPLTAEESRDMLDPVLDTLAYLHGEGFVHSRLKPANIMAVDDRLKISSDGLCPVGESTTGFGKASVFDSPEVNEVNNGGVSPAADVWSLGVTLVDVLTQRLPQKNEQGEPLRLEAMPAPFLEIVRHCLRRDLRQRWTIAQIQDHVKQLSSEDPVIFSPEPAKPGVKWRFVVPIAIGLVAVLLAGPRLFRHSAGEVAGGVPGQAEPGQEPPQDASGSPGSPDQTTAASGSPGGATLSGPSEQSRAERIPAEKPKAAPPASSPTSGGHANADTSTGAGSADVVHEVVPDVPRQARNTITGKVKVSVRVHVDSTGSVSDAKFDSAGPSQYFARLAMEAARGWKFASAADDNGKARQWVLHFEFSRGGTRVVPVRIGS